MDDPLRKNSEIPTWNRISQIELNTSFIHNQYRTIMKRLHSEIELLKSANRDLQFQLVLLRNAPVATDCELDCASRHCILRVKCEQCSRYTPLTVTNVRTDANIRKLLNDEFCQTEIFGPEVRFEPENKENFADPNLLTRRLSRSTFNLPNSSLNQILASQDEPRDQTNSILASHETRDQTNLSHKLTELPIRRRSTSLQRPIDANLPPVVHKTYVLSIEDADPLSHKKKIQKTIVWSKRQSASETERIVGTNETPCILPPLQHWQESSCTTAANKLQPTNTTPTLPEIVSKK